MNYKKLNEIKAGKAVYKHDGTLEQLHEVEMYCEGTDSHIMKGVALYYHMRKDDCFSATSSPTPPPDTTVYGSKDIFTEQSDDMPKQSDNTQVQPETKVKSVKTYTITLTEYEDGWIDLNRVCEGFSYFEVIGVLKKVSELVDMDFNGFKVK